MQFPTEPCIPRPSRWVRRCIARSDFVKVIQRFVARPQNRNTNHEDYEGGHIAFPLAAREGYAVAFRSLSSA
jgi:hypothetical protein